METTVWLGGLWGLGYPNFCFGEPLLEGLTNPAVQQVAMWLLDPEHDAFQAKAKMKFMIWNFSKKRKPQGPQK